MLTLPRMVEDTLQIQCSSKNSLLLYVDGSKRVLYATLSVSIFAFLGCGNGGNSGGGRGGGGGRTTANSVASPVPYSLLAYGLAILPERTAIR